jgi:hypothetical protein
MKRNGFVSSDPTTVTAMKQFRFIENFPSGGFEVRRWRSSHLTTEPSRSSRFGG